MKPGINIDNVFFGYQKNHYQLVGINIMIPKGTFCGITGINGSGKSTLLYLLNGLIPHEIDGVFKGNVFIDGINTREGILTSKVGMVFQNPDFMIFNLSVHEEVEFGLHNMKFDNIQKRVKDALQMVSMEGYENRDPHTLSYGEKQKLCLACVLALEPDYIVLDEPTAMLDYKSSAHLYEILKKLNDKGKTVIIVEHDTDFLLKYAQKTIVIHKGQVKFNSMTKQVFSQIDTLKKIGIKVPLTL